MPKTKLKRFELSSCRLNDAALMYVIDCLSSDKQISCVKLSDNFFSEQIEHVMLEALNKNTTLTEVNLAGNRFSHSCLTKLKKIT